MPALVLCPGCGASVPDVDCPVHAYIRSAPGCWQLYGEVLARGTAVAALLLRIA